MNKLLKIVCGLGGIVGMVGFFGELGFSLNVVVDRALPANGEGWLPWYHNACIYARWRNHLITEVKTKMQGSECNRLVAGTSAATEPWRNLPSHIPPNGEGWIFLGSAPAPGCVYARWVNSKVVQITQISSNGFICAFRPAYSVVPPSTNVDRLATASNTSFTLLSKTPSPKTSSPKISEISPKISEIIVDSSLPSSGSGWVWENRPDSCVLGSWANHRMRTVAVRRNDYRCEALVESTYRNLSR